MACDVTTRSVGVFLPLEDRSAHHNVRTVVPKVVFISKTIMTDNPTHKMIPNLCPYRYPNGNNGRYPHEKTSEFLEGGGGVTPLTCWGLT